MPSFFLKSHPAILLAASLLCGCVTHEVKIRVLQDGSMRYEVESRGERKDIHEGIQIIVPKGASLKEWQDEEQQFHQRFRVTVARAQDPPALLNVHATGLTKNPDQPCKLKVLQEKTKTTYHLSLLFARIDHPIERHLNRMLPRDLRRKYQQQAWGELSEEDRAKVVSTYIAASVEQLAREHLEAIRTPMNHIERRRRNAYRTQLAQFTKQYISTLQAQANVEKNHGADAIASLLENIQREIHQVFRTAFPEEQEVLLTSQAHLRDVLRRIRLAEDLRDEHFTIRIRMPGHITHSNGTQEAQGVLWQIRGPVLWYRQQMLEVYSEVVRLQFDFPSELREKLSEESKKILNEHASSRKITVLGPDPFQRDIIWVQDVPGFLMSLNGKTGELMMHEPACPDIVPDSLKVLCHQFGPRCVWVGTNQGLLAMDRRTGYWHLYAVDRQWIHHPVVALHIKNGILEVETASDDASHRNHQFHLKKRRWITGESMPPQPAFP